MTDLTEADRAILAELLREAIAAYQFPLLPRVRRLEAILDKLDSPQEPGHSIIGRMPTDDLTPDDRSDLTALLREALAVSPPSPRIRRLRAILDKLDPPRVVEVMPPPKPPSEPSLALQKKRRR